MQQLTSLITTALIPLLIAALLIAIGARLAKKLKPNPQNSFAETPPSSPAPRYRKAQSLLTPAEKTFFAVLKQAVPEVPIFPKVRVADVIQPQKRYSGDFLRISQKHFDWILCHPVSFEPLVAIELDDSSHNRRRTQENDATKNTAANEAGLILLRFAWQQSYDVDKIRVIIAEKINAL